MEWIKCSDRMPEDGEYVIVATNGAVWAETHFVEDDMISGERMWFSANNEADAIPIQSFTHWMPLPPPPTE